MEEDRRSVDPDLGSPLSLLLSRQRYILSFLGFFLARVSYSDAGNIG